MKILLASMVLLLASSVAFAGQAQAEKVKAPPAKAEVKKDATYQRTVIRARFHGDQEVRRGIFRGRLRGLFHREGGLLHRGGRGSC